jgi:hypothetical protein
MASPRKRGPVAFRPRLSAGLALSLTLAFTIHGDNSRQNQKNYSCIGQSANDASLTAMVSSSTVHWHPC